MDIRVTKIDDRKFLRINNEMVEVVDYTIKSSAGGSTELTVSIKGDVTVFDLSAILKE